MYLLWSFTPSRFSKLTCRRSLRLCSIQIQRYRRPMPFQQLSWALSRTLRFWILSILPLSALLAIATQSEAATGAIALCWRGCTAPITPLCFPLATLICATHNKANWTAIWEELAYQCHPVLYRDFLTHCAGVHLVHPSAWNLFPGSMADAMYVDFWHLHKSTIPLVLEEASTSTYRRFRWVPPWAMPLHSGNSDCIHHLAEGHSSELFRVYPTAELRIPTDGGGQWNHLHHVHLLVCESRYKTFSISSWPYFCRVRSRLCRLRDCYVVCGERRGQRHGYSAFLLQQNRSRGAMLISIDGS